MTTDRLRSVLHRRPWLWGCLGGAIGLGVLLGLRFAPVVTLIALAVLGTAFLMFFGWYMVVNLRDLRDFYRRAQEEEECDV